MVVPLNRNQICILPRKGVKKQGRTGVLSTTQFQDLPQELMVEIFSRLPVKSLWKFKTIDKNWESLISDGTFTLCNNHGQREKLLLFLKSESGILSGSSALPYCSIGQQLLAEGSWNPFAGCRFLGSCRGLLFFADTQNIHLWNPSTKYTKVVHHLYNLGQRCYNAVGSGVLYDEYVDDYKVVILLRCQWKESKTIVVLFSYLKSITWTKKKFSFGSRIGETNSATPVVNGNLHLVVLDGKRKGKDYITHSIIYFECKTNDIKTLPKPDSKYAVQDLIYGLGVIEECLCMVRPQEEFIEVLLMKEYGVKESWMIMFTLLRSTLNDYIGYSLVPLFLTKNGEVVMVENHTKVLVYNCKKNSPFADDFELPTSIQSLLPSCSIFGFNYVESLENGNQARPMRRKRDNKLGNFVYF